MLVVQEMAKKLGVKVRLMRLFSKNAGEIGMQILSKFIGYILAKEKMVKSFVEEKKQIYEDSLSNYKIQHQKVLEA